jgi:DNA-3-methyladenine glycosylase
VTKRSAGPSVRLAPLLPGFYLDSAEIVARGLLGKLLIRRLDGEVLTGRIVETEAYLGNDDPAAHAFAGMTSRNSVIFGPPGRAYVYFIYGMHYCLNVSCEPEGDAGCVLLRALEPVEGLSAMASLRNLSLDARPQLLTSGPGRLCQALGITRAEQNGMDLTSSRSNLLIADDGFPDPEITVTQRIGIRKAADRPLRFLVTGNKFVSGPVSGPRVGPLPSRD